MGHFAKFILVGLTLILLCFTTIRCNKSNASNSAIVNLTIDLSLPQYATLNVPNNYVYVPNYGVRGLIIYRASMTQFNVYDRSCSYLPSNSCAPLVVISTFTCADTCKNCRSQFNLTNGFVTKGPATLPLTQYQNTFDGVSLLRIYN